MLASMLPATGTDTTGLTVLGICLLVMGGLSWLLALRGARSK
jgi:LPXTG-motif cell wall-anchored protein